MRFFVNVRIAKGGKPYFAQAAPPPESVVVSVKDVEPPWRRSCVNPSGGFATLTAAELEANKLRMAGYGLDLEYMIEEAN